MCIVSIFFTTILLYSIMKLIWLIASSKKLVLLMKLSVIPKKERFMMRMGSVLLKKEKPNHKLHHLIFLTCFFRLQVYMLEYCSYFSYCA